MSTDLRSSSGVTIFGDGALGGKGTGLLRVNECGLPRANNLPTYILTTSFFERYLNLGRSLDKETIDILKGILREIADAPVGVRSSATNEGGVKSARGWAIRAGENISFMLPNNHPDQTERFNQFELAVRHVYERFIKQGGNDAEKMAVVINPIPGIFDDTLAGPFYYPYISGVANSYFPHALKTQDPRDGFARIAFGHGYATVLDDFPVISMATIKNPIPLKYLQAGNAQQFFYALDMSKNRGLRGEELETMKRLHVRLANFHKIKLLGVKNEIITIEELVEKNHFGFKDGLVQIMESISAKISSHFQIEFVFNIDFKKKPYEDGFFHVVQLTLLPEMVYEPVVLPDQDKHRYLSIGNIQGQGVKKGIKHTLVISPFLYCRDMHDQVKEKLSQFNQKMRRQKEPYILIVPGRLGSKNPEWGISVDFRDVDQAVAIFEYGVDIAGRAEPLPDESSLTGGIYGSHFLYMIQGGYDEDQKRLQTRIFGTQGTHFLTNIMTNNVFYGYIIPGKDALDPWLFAPPESDSPLYLLTFPQPVAIFADASSQRCLVVAE